MPPWLRCARRRRLSGTVTTAAPRLERGLVARREWLALAGLAAGAGGGWRGRAGAAGVGGAARFAGLGAQGFWFEGWLPPGYVLGGGGGLVSELAPHETPPPAYFVCVWLWSHVFGTGEAGLRSLS